MKRYLITICCSLLAYSSVYASFPIVQNSSDEIIVVDNKLPIDPVNPESSLADASLVLGLLWFPFMLAFLALLGGPEIFAIVMLIGSIASFIGAIVTGIMSLSKEKSRRWKAFVGLGLTLGLILVPLLATLFSGIFEGVGDYFY